MSFSTEQAALAYRARGWSVIPVLRADKRPALPWQAYQDRSADEDEIRSWFRRWPAANLAIVTGRLSGLVVLDVDPGHGGEQSVRRLVAEHGRLPATVEARTGGGGRHLYFRHPGGTVHNKVGLAPGIDLRGDGGLASAAETDSELSNASDKPVTRAPGMCFFDSALAFDMIRGGHIDIVVLGAYQVSEKGDLANWGRPGRPATGMGGAMDLAVGAGRVIVTMLHTTREGGPRIVKECTFPLTASRCVSLIVTDIAVLDVTGNVLVLRETAPGWTFDDVQQLTEARLTPAPDLKEIEL